MTTRAKFKCTEVAATENGSKVRFSVVSGGSPENDVFFKWTPFGTIDIGIVNPDTVEQFIPGQTYYVDFTKADTTFVERILEEKSSLDDKNMKLIQFLDTDKFKELTSTAQSLLRKQSEIMTEYSVILSERLLNL